MVCGGGVREGVWNVVCLGESVGVCVGVGCGSVWVVGVCGLWECVGCGSVSLGVSMVGNWANSL